MTVHRTVAARPAPPASAKRRAGPLAGLAVAAAGDGPAGADHAVVAAGADRTVPRWRFQQAGRRTPRSAAVVAAMTMLQFLSAMPAWRPGGLPGWVVAVAAAMVGRRRGADRRRLPTQPRPARPARCCAGRRRSAVVAVPWPGLLCGPVPNHPPPVHDAIQSPRFLRHRRWSRPCRGDSITRSPVTRPECFNRNVAAQRSSTAAAVLPAARGATDRRAVDRVRRLPDHRPGREGRDHSRSADRDLGVRRLFPRSDDPRQVGTAESPSTSSTNCRCPPWCICTVVARPADVRRLPDRPDPARRSSRRLDHPA